MMDINRELVDEVIRLRQERDRLLKLFEDAGQGEHNVLALIDHYQDSAISAEEMLRAARQQLSRAVSLLHMLDRAEARHPDVAAFLDSMDGDSNGGQ
jgi:hypothetical protein